ncbi:MAG: hypothetical protein R3C49_22835 [Planctomycetaceae bacterium]
MGATGYTESPCVGAGRRLVSDSPVLQPIRQSRTEIIVPADVCQQIVEHLRLNVMPSHHLTVCVETVEVARLASFVSLPEIPSGEVISH